MCYELLFSICSVAVMLFSAYVAYKTYAIHIFDSRPKFRKISSKYGFRYHVNDDVFHLDNWVIKLENIGGKTAVIDSIIFKVTYQRKYFIGKIDSFDLLESYVPPGAFFTVDIGSVLKFKNSADWNVSDFSYNTKNSHSFIGKSVTGDSLDFVEIISCKNKPRSYYV